MVADVQMRTGRDLQRISRELRAMNDKELKKRFRQGMRTAARPMVPAVRRAIRQIPSKRPYSADGLRGSMSKATRLEVRTVGKSAGVRIWVDGRRMPDHQKALQSYMEGLKPRWRHPVFGNSENWVQQKPKPYFFKTVYPMGLRTRPNLNRIINQVARDIT